MEDYIDKLIAKHLANESSEADEKQLQELILKNKEIEKKYNQSKAVWQKSDITQKKYDLNRGMYLVNKKIDQSQNTFIIRLQQTIKYAAIFVGIMLISFLTKQELSREETIMASENKIIRFVLPDSSVVNLNKNSQISYNSSRLKKFDRKVKLSGEAYFEIEKLDNRKFIVDAGNLDVQVLGTKFNVKQNRIQTTVTLNEGKVRLLNFEKDKNEQIIMHPGDLVSYNSDLNKTEQKKVNASVYNIWSKDKLIFDNFSIEDLSEIFKIQYQKTLVINDNEFNGIIMGSAPTNNLNLLLKSFSEILGKEINIQNDSIIIE
ncbi:MAG: FecR domain-containing protein [Bacteroidetes bacterium]|nr:FecR domain-containing protein [Bacteroidota bacterium]